MLIIAGTTLDRPTGTSLVITVCVHAAYPLIPTVDIGRVASQSQIPDPTSLITVLTSSPSWSLWTMIGRPASPPPLT